MRAIVIGAGRGRRLMPMTADAPKCYAEVQGRRLLDWALRAFAAAEITDQKGWTYHHHVDMACWRGRLYVGWNSCERDEDVWPSRELYSASVDGMSWSDPQEMFPQGVSTPLRMYFFHATNGRMFMIAGLRADTLRRCQRE